MATYKEIRVAGVTRRVPSVLVNERVVVATGKLLKIAAIEDEDFQEGEIVSNPEEFIATLRNADGFRADLFTFSEKFTDPAPRFPYFREMDSVAAIRVLSYSDWWTNRVSKYLRQDVKRAAKMGVEVRPVPFTDEFIRGVVEIYDETPVRQGRPFWHYKKGFDAVKLATGTYLDRSEFLGAYFGDELIGFIKMVYVDKTARLMQILSKAIHKDRRPTNALIAKAIELCDTRGCTHLTYGKYRYSEGADSSLTMFKHRNGFEEILVPKYYVPLTAKGALSLRLRLHHGPKQLLPTPLRDSIAKVRATIYRRPLFSSAVPKPSN